MVNKESTGGVYIISLVDSFCVSFFPYHLHGRAAQSIADGTAEAMSRKVAGENERRVGRIEFAQGTEEILRHLI